MKTELQIAKLDMCEWSRMATSYRLRGFIEYATCWEKETEKLFKRFPQFEDELIDAQDLGIALAMSENAKGMVS
jgi:hypothetical protein